MLASCIILWHIVLASWGVIRLTTTFRLSPPTLVTSWPSFRNVRCLRRPSAEELSEWGISASPCTTSLISPRFRRSAESQGLGDPGPPRPLLDILRTPRTALAWFLSCPFDETDSRCRTFRSALLAARRDRLWACPRTAPDTILMSHLGVKGRFWCQIEVVIEIPWCEIWHQPILRSHFGSYWDKMWHHWDIFRSHCLVFEVTSCGWLCAIWQKSGVRWHLVDIDRYIP